MDDPAHRPIIEPIDAVGIKKPLKPPLNAENVPAAIDRADHNCTDHCVQTRTISPPCDYANSFVRGNYSAMLCHVRSLRHQAVTVKEQIILKRNLKAL